MAEKILKALAIKSKSNPPGKSEYKWDVIPELPNFTRNIVIPELGIEKDGTAKVDIGAIVSGMPTVYARANMFRNALDNVKDKSAETSGLMLFYKSLITEWRGLISCIALNYKDIEIKRLTKAFNDLGTSTSKKIETLENDLKNALKRIKEAKDTRATRLDLGNCGLTELPEELFELTWLEELMLSNEGKIYDFNKKEETWFFSDNLGTPNKIKKLPSNFNKLKNLKILLANTEYRSRTGFQDLSPLIGLNNLQFT